MNARVRPLSRRAVLRGAGGVTVALPLLDLMRPRRAHAAASPPRFVVFYTPNGTNDYDAFLPQPAGNGPITKLGVETEPLLPLKDKLTAITGLVHEPALAQSGTVDEHANGMTHLLTCVKYAEGPKVDDVSAWGGGISIDQKIAQAVGGATKFPSLELGVQSTLGVGVHPFSRMVYKDKLQPVPAQDDPREVWKRLFSGATPPAGGGAPGVDLALEQRKSVLDFVRDDFQRLIGRAGAHDAQKLDAHATAIRELEQRLTMPTPSPATTCKTPTPPDAAVNPMDPKQFPAMGKLQMDLLTLALACDLTRVATMQWSWARSDVVMSWINVKDSHHDLSHGPSSAALSSVNRWYAQQLAYLGAAMNAVDEGDGTLLDHAIVWWCSDVSFGPQHSFTEARAFLLGRGGGYLKRLGQQVNFPEDKPGSITQLMVSFMQAMGMTSATSFGESSSKQGPLPGIA